MTGGTSSCPGRDAACNAAKPGPIRAHERNGSPFCSASFRCACCAAPGTRGPRLRDPAAHLRPRVYVSSPLKSKGAGNAGCTAAPAASCAKKRAHELSHHRSGRVTGIPCTMFYDLSRALPAIGLFVTVAGGDPGKHRRQLHASAAASSARFPKFVHPCGPTFANFRKQRH
jgi:hypothetical protein